MSHLFKIIPYNFFQLLSSPNKDIYVDCLFILEKLTQLDDNFRIDKNIAVDHLEKYLTHQVTFVLEEEKQKEHNIIINNRQKAYQIINIFKKNGWIGEEKINFEQTYLNFFDYSLEMIHFLRRTINKVDTESIGNIYSIYSLLNFFITEKNYAAFCEAILKTQNLVVKLKILKANIYRFSYQLLNTNFQENIQHVLEQLLFDYKINFFDSSYYLLKTNDNFFKYRRKINFFIQEILNNSFYINFLTENLQKIKKITDFEAKKQIYQQIEQMKNNFVVTDKLIQMIDRKNEEYLKIACERILFFDKQKDNSQLFLNYLIQLILSNNKDYYIFFHFYPIKYFDDLSFYKPRRHKQQIPIVELDIISEDTQFYLQQKMTNFNQDKFYNRKNINNFVKQLFMQNKVYKASELNLLTNEDITRLILIYFYANSSSRNIYCIKDLQIKITEPPIIFDDFCILPLKEEIDKN
ncbi:MAG: DUF5716 family protein [Vigna little leaf phytoplasma]|nr:DUF5716 family protein [Vigna little leaf phytoplasma]